MRHARIEERLPKKATNVSVRQDLLKMAKDDGLNLSGMLEGCLLDYNKKKRGKDWLERNKKALSDMSSFVEEFGVFSEGRRLF